VSEVDRPGYPGIGSDSISASSPTVEQLRSVVGTDLNGGGEPSPWIFLSAYRPAPTPPPPKRHPRRLWTILLVALVPVMAVGVSRMVWPAAPTSPPWAPSSASPAALPPAAAPPVIPSGASSGSLDLSALAAGVDPAVMDINTQLSDSNDQGAGTGIVLSSSGAVLTNNHVINGAISADRLDR
jgi:hypothetical protein